MVATATITAHDRLRQLSRSGPVISVIRGSPSPPYRRGRPGKAHEHALLSLATLDTAHAAPGTEVTVVWGEDPVTAKPQVEEHTQREIRATVAPAPYVQFARTRYRSS